MDKAPSYRGLSLSRVIVLALSLLDHVAAQNQAAYTCANLADNGKLYTTGGVTFELKCGHGTHAKSLPSVPSASLKECADKCAQDPQCQSCDWTPAIGMCNPKGEYIPTFAHGAYDTWFPIAERPKRQCPTGVDILTAPKVNPQVVDAPKCPTDDGNMLVSDDGAYWTYICCAHNKDNLEIPNSRSVVKSTNECASKCGSTVDCHSFVVSSVGQTNPPMKNPDVLGTCKLYKTGEFEHNGCGDDTHDYGYITAPPAIDSPDTMTVACATECPLADGREYKSKGELFHIDCAKRHGTEVIFESIRQSLKDCMDACSKYIPCHSVDYHTSSKKCYFGKHHGAPTIAAPGFQSAYSLGCAGACDSQGCCGDNDTSDASDDALSGSGNNGPPGPGNNGGPPSTGNNNGGPPSGGNNGPPGTGNNGGPPGTGNNNGGPPGTGNSGGPPGTGNNGGPPGTGSNGPPGTGNNGGPPGTGNTNGGPPSTGNSGGPPGTGSNNGGPPGTGSNNGGPPSTGKNGGPPGTGFGPPQPLAPGQCPIDDGKRRTVGGVTYTVMCKKAYSTGHPKSLKHVTEEACVKACSADSTCQGANFNTQTSECELHPKPWVGQPKYTGDVTYWIAYRPIQER